MKYRTSKQVKQALLNGIEVKINRWAALINKNDEVEIWDPKGKGVVASLAHLDRAVVDFYRMAQGIPDKMPKPVTYESTPSGSGPLGDDSSQDKPWTDPKVNKQPVMSGPTSDPDLKDDTSQDAPWKDPKVNTRPQPNKGRGGLPDTDLGKDTQKNDVEWEDKLTGPEVFRMAQDASHGDFKEYLDSYFPKLASWVSEQGYDLLDKPREDAFGAVVYPTESGEVELQVMKGSTNISDNLDQAGTLELNLFEGDKRISSTYFRLDDPFAPHEMSLSQPESFGDKSKASFRMARNRKKRAEVDVPAWLDAEIDKDVGQCVNGLRSRYGDMGLREYYRNNPAEFEDAVVAELENSIDQLNQGAMIELGTEIIFRDQERLLGKAVDAFFVSFVRKYHFGMSDEELYECFTDAFNYIVPPLLELLERKEASRKAQDMDPGSDGQSEMGESDPDTEYYPEIEHEPHQIENKGEAPSNLPDDLGGRNNARKGFVDTFDKQATPEFSYQELVQASPSQSLLTDIADPERWAATQAVKSFATGMGRGLYKEYGGKRDKANKGMSNMRGNPPGEAEAGCGADYEDEEKPKAKKSRRRRSYLTPEDLGDFETVDILSTEEGTFEIKIDDRSQVAVVHDDRVLTPMYYGEGQVGWDYSVPQEVDLATSELFLSLEEEDPQAFGHLYTEDESEHGTFQPAYDTKKSRRRRSQANPHEFDWNIDELAWDLYEANVSPQAFKEEALQALSSKFSPDDIAELGEVDDQVWEAIFTTLEGMKTGKARRSRRRQAGPKLKENWTTDGGYTRDIEAETPEELYHLTRSFGSDDDYDWSSISPQREVIEDPGNGVPVEARKAQSAKDVHYSSEGDSVDRYQYNATTYALNANEEIVGILTVSDFDNPYSGQKEYTVERFEMDPEFDNSDVINGMLEYTEKEVGFPRSEIESQLSYAKEARRAVDDKAKSYWRDYFNDYGEDLVKDDSTKKNRKETEPKVDETPKPAGQQKVKARRRRAEMDEDAEEMYAQLMNDEYSYNRALEIVREYDADMINIKDISADFLEEFGSGESPYWWEDIARAFVEEVWELDEYEKGKSKDRPGLNPLYDPDKYGSRRRGQAAPAAPPEAAPPGGMQQSPETAPQTPPQAPAGQPPVNQKPQKAPGSGDEGLKTLGWTDQDIKLMSDDDKQKILQVQLHKPGSGAPAAGAPTGQQPAQKPPAKPAPPAPQSGPAPMPAEPEQGMPQPVARRVRRESRERMKIARAFRMLAQAAPVEQGQVPPAPQTSPSQPTQTGPQTAPAAPGTQPSPTVSDEFSPGTDMATPETEAMQIYNEILQKEVKASSPEQVPALKSQELVQRLLTEVGMPMSEARQLFGLKSGDGFNKLFQ